MSGPERRYRKKALKPAIKRELVSYLAAQFAMSIRQACRTLSLSRTVYFYQPDTRRDEPVIRALTELAERYPRYGFKKLFQLLRRQGNTWNHKRVHRIYCLLKLNFRRKGKQRLPVRNPASLATPGSLNQSWSIDFMHDALVCGRRFRTFNVVDDFNREALAIEIDLNIPAQRVVRVLDRIVANRGYPLKMRMDNGPNWSHWRWPNGPKNMVCSSNLSSRVSLHKMLLSNGSTGHTEQKSWIFICSEH